MFRVSTVLHRRSDQRLSWSGIAVRIRTEQGHTRTDSRFAVAAKVLAVVSKLRASTSRLSARIRLALRPHAGHRSSKSDLPESLAPASRLAKAQRRAQTLRWRRRRTVSGESAAKCGSKECAEQLCACAWHRSYTVQIVAQRFSKLHSPESNPVAKRCDRRSEWANRFCASCLRDRSQHR